MPLPDHVKATFWFQNEGFLTSFSLYYLVQNGSLTQTNVVAFADALKAHYATQIAACLPDSAFLDRVDIRSTDNGIEVEGGSSDLSTAGTVAGDSLPEHDCVCIRRKTGFTGRAKRGRIFFPFVPESFSENDGTLTGGAIAAYRAFATKLDTNFVSAGTGVTVQHVQPVPSQTLLLPVVRTELVENIVTRRDRQREGARRSVLPVA